MHPGTEATVKMWSGSQVSSIIQKTEEWGSNYGSESMVNTEGEEGWTPRDAEIHK